jgi:uncharacterized membrane protein
MDPEIDRDSLPFVAPCRRLGPLAPFRWLARGFADLRAAPAQSLSYGLAVAAATAVVALLTWSQGSQWILFAMLGGFVFMAPLCCIGLYALSAQLERGLEPSLKRSLRAAFRRHLGNEMVFALVLLVIGLVWARAAIVVTVFYPTDGDSTLTELAGFYAFGTSIGAIFAGVVFSASAFSLPMIMHRDIDTVTAIVTSVNATLRNLPAMLVWLTLIVALLAIGLATFCIALVVFVPLIGFAAWHGYLDTIDAGAFPRHSVGITAAPRARAADAEVEETASGSNAGQAPFR